MSTIHQVLNTYELLENILLNLPLHTLLHSKRVSKSFSNVIDRSEDIRKALFLQAATDDTIEFARDPQAPVIYWKGWQWSNGDLVDGGLAPLMNPWLFLRGDGPASLVVATEPSTTFPPMLISHPPMRTLVSDYPGSGGSKFLRSVTPTGARLSDLREVVRRLQESHDGAVDEGDYEPRYLYGTAPCTTAMKDVREVTAMEILKLLAGPVLQDHVTVGVRISELEDHEWYEFLGTKRKRPWPMY